MSPDSSKTRKLSSRKALISKASRSESKDSGQSSTIPVRISMSTGWKAVGSKVYQVLDLKAYPMTMNLTVLQKPGLIAIPSGTPAGPFTGDLPQVSRRGSAYRSGVCTSWGYLGPHRPRTGQQYLQTLDQLAEYDESNSGQSRIPHRAILDIYENLEALEFDLPPAEQLNLQFSVEELPSPEVSVSFKGVLKGYQQDGYRWLAYLDEKGTGGLLADEMGLGKTVQVIAHMARLADEGRLRPSLIVCPKTLITNWGAEIRRFFPSQKRVGVLQGGRANADELAGFDIVLMSYDTLRHRQFEIAKVNWELVVSDEAQFAKNPDGTKKPLL